MSANDCVSRRAVLILLNATTREEITDECYDRLYDAVARMDAAPQEMSARELYSAYQRICEEYSHKGIPVRCYDCPFYADCPRIGWALRMAAEFSPNVEKWAREHPEEGEE